MRAFVLVSLIVFAWGSGALVAQVSQSTAEYPFHNAASKGDLEAVKRYVAEGRGLESTGLNGNTPIILAGMGGHSNVVRYLFEQGAKVDVYNLLKDNELHLLHYVISNGWLDLLREIQSRLNIKLNRLMLYPLGVRENYNGMVIMPAVLSGNLEMVRFLVGQGVSVRAAMPVSKLQPIHFAVSKGDMAMVEFLLQKRASASARTKSGFEPIHLATSMGLIKVAKNQGTYQVLNYLHYAQPWVDDRVVSTRLVKGKSKKVTMKELGAERLGLVRLLVKKGALPKARVGRGGTQPIHMASAVGNLEMVKYLATKGAHLRAKGDLGEPMHYAAAQGQLHVVDYLYKKRADVNARNGQGKIPADLHLVRIGNRADEAFVKYWRQKRAYIFEVDNYGRDWVTRLSMTSGFAFFKENYEKGFNIRKVDYLGNGMVYLVVRHRRSPRDIMQFLRFLVEEEGMSVSNRNHFGQQAIHYGFRDMAVFNYLVEKGADPAAADAFGNQLIHAASSMYNGKLDLVRLLVEEKGISINTPNKQEETPLLFLSRATRFSSLEMRRQYTDKKGNRMSDVLYSRPRWMNPPHMPQGVVEAYKYFLDSGAKVNLKQFKFPEGNAVLHNVVGLGSHLAQNIERHNRNYTPQLLEVVQLLISNGALVSPKNTKGETPLHMSAKNGLFEVSQFLVNAGARTEDLDKARKTPLIYALEGKHFPTASFLVERMKLSPNRKYYDGNTLVHVLSAQEPSSVGADLSEVALGRFGETKADESKDTETSTQSFQSEMVRQLAERGAKINLPNAKGLYPLHLAAQSGNVGLLIYFVQNGVDILKRDRQGRDALYHAVVGASAAKEKFGGKFNPTTSSSKRHANAAIERRLGAYNACVRELLRTKKFNRVSVSSALIIAKNSGVENIRKQLIEYQ